MCGPRVVDVAPPHAQVLVVKMESPDGALLAREVKHLAREWRRRDVDFVEPWNVHRNFFMAALGTRNRSKALESLGTARLNGVSISTDDTNSAQRPRIAYANP
jgi:hypothetical protein